jgi:hypothetical protein
MMEAEVDMDSVGATTGACEGIEGWQSMHLIGVFYDNN